MKIVRKIPITLDHTIQTFNKPETGGFFENILEKEDNADNQHVFLFPEHFLPVPKPVSDVSHIHVFCCFDVRVI